MCVKSAHLNLKASGINTASVQYYGDYIKGVDFRMILEFGVFLAKFFLSPHYLEKFPE